MIYARATFQKQQIRLRAAMSHPAVNRYEEIQEIAVRSTRLDHSGLPLGISGELWLWALADFCIAHTRITVTYSQP